MPIGNAAFGDARAKHEISSNSSALVFVLNASFLPGFYVLLYSLTKAKSLLNLPVVVISEDRAVVEDPLVTTVADQIQLVSQNQIAAFSSIPGDRVHARSRLDWIPKYTFMKWMMYSDMGYSQHIFLDVDTLCIAPLDSLLEYSREDFYAAPMFEQHLYSHQNTELAQATIDSNIQNFGLSSEPRSERLNTGVVVANERLLSDSFRKDLIAFAENHSYPTEQMALRRFVQSSPDYTWRQLPPTYNFHYNYVNRMSASQQLSVLRQIKLLHFVGSQANPWDSSHPHSVPHALWHAYAREASRYIEIPT